MKTAVLNVVIVCFSLLAAGCSESRYEPFCDELSGRDYKTCLIDSDYRDQYLSEQVEQDVKLKVRILERLPTSLLAHTITNDIRRDSVRLESISDIPVQVIDFGITANTNPDLVGRYYVARAAVSSAYSGDQWEGPNVWLTEIEGKENSLSLETDRLTKAQIECLDHACGLFSLCVGEFYIQILPNSVGWLSPYLVGADIDPIGEATIRESYRKWLRRRLDDLDNLDTGT